MNGIRQEMAGILAHTLAFWAGGLGDGGNVEWERRELGEVPCLTDGGGEPHGEVMKIYWILGLVLGTMVLARQAKEGDKDVNYDESKIPAYDLPELLVTVEGKRITTAEEWREVRRPQIMSLFSNLIYGRSRRRWR